MITVFCGYDVRESIGFHVFAHSLIRHASKPVAIIPLGSAAGLEDGSNAFTLSRFLVAKMMGNKGHAIFVDACDMLMEADIAQLDALFDPRYAVQLVKHAPYKTRHRTKYRGTSMECPNLNYERKNWASVMLINCQHSAWCIDPLELTTSDLLQFKFIRDEEIGELPPQWNCLVDEGQSSEGANILHWTAGVPGFEMYDDAPQALLWKVVRTQMNQLG